LHKQKGNADDVLIIKNNEVTDTSFANVIFFDGNRWVTPKHPLLPGTQRAFLLENGIISEAVIKFSDIPAFQKIRIINAMIRFEDRLEVKVNT
jgi:4-amino-4-deoxychorismate lyase